MGNCIRRWPACACARSCRCWNCSAALESSDAVFFGPVLPAPGQSIDDAAAGVFALLEHLRSRGITALADIHDDHFEVPGHIQYFTGLVRKADAVFANSDAMANLVANYTQRPVRVIDQQERQSRRKAACEHQPAAYEAAQQVFLAQPVRRERRAAQPFNDGAV